MRTGRIGPMAAAIFADQPTRAHRRPDRRATKLVARHPQNYARRTGALGRKLPAEEAADG